MSGTELASAARPVIGRAQRWFAGSVIAALVTAAAAIAPFSSTALVPVPGLLAMFSSAMIVINLLLAALLYIKGRVEGSSDTIRLGSAYLYVCLIIIPQTASFPGALMATPLIGSPESSLWFWVFWHVGFGVAVIRYAWLYGEPLPRGATLLRPIVEVVAVMLLLSGIATFFAAALPRLMVGGHFEFSGAGFVTHAVVVGVTFTALASVARLRAATQEQLWLLVGLTASCFEVWMTLHGSARYALGWYMAKAGSLLTSIVVLLSLMHEITRLYSQAALANRTLTTLAQRDGLTGLANRRHFDEVLAQEFRRALRQQMPLALVMADVDHFKGYNDRYGHPAGDDCLRHVCGAIARALRRPGEQAARYGGEEIAIILPATDLGDAVLIAERLRQTVADLRIAHAGSDCGFVTVSSGVSCFHPGRGGDAEALVTAADRALYQAKRDGRNRVRAEPCGQFSGPLPSFAAG